MIASGIDELGLLDDDHYGLDTGWSPEPIEANGIHTARGNVSVKVERNTVLVGQLSVIVSGSESLRVVSIVWKPHGMRQTDRGAVSAAISTDMARDYAVNYRLEQIYSFHRK